VRLRPGIVLIFTLLLAACGTPRTPLPIQTHPDADKVFFVASNGWHSGIIVAKADLPSDRIPETKNFPDALFLEFGWGDADYFPAKKPTIGMTLRAAFVPTPSVMHVVGLQADPARAYPNAEILSLPLNKANFNRLIDFIHASFERPEEGRATNGRPGLYATSRFFPARGRFHLLNTCNSWTARALMSAGFDMDLQGTARAEEVMRQVRALALSQ
jgi:uncharacterized protein (TIGR02117 family)